MDFRQFGPKRIGVDYRKFCANCKCVDLRQFWTKRIGVDFRELWAKRIDVDIRKLCVKRIAVDLQECSGEREKVFRRSTTSGDFPGGITEAAGFASLSRRERETRVWVQTSEKLSQPPNPRLESFVVVTDP